MHQPGSAPVDPPRLQEEIVVDRRARSNSHQHQLIFVFIVMAHALAVSSTLVKERIIFAKST